MQFHRNSQKRFYGEDKIYYIVTKTHNNYPYFREKILCDLFIEDLKLCKRLKGFKLYGFSIIYDHVNLLLKPNKEYNISKVMQSIKKESSRDINYIIPSEGDISIPSEGDVSIPPEGDIPECRLQGNQYSERYDKIIKIPNLSHFRDKFLQKHGPNHNFPKFKWQKSFYDHTIRNIDDFQKHWRYVSLNFAKHGLPDNWPYWTENYEEMIEGMEI